MTDGQVARERIVAALREMADTALRTADQILPDLERAAAMIRATVRSVAWSRVRSGERSAATARRFFESTIFSIGLLPLL